MSKTDSDKTITELVIELEQSKQRLAELQTGKRDAEIRAKVAEIWPPEKQAAMQKEIDASIAEFSANINEYLKQSN